MATYEEYLKILSEPVPSVRPSAAPQDLIDAVMGVESSGNPNAVSPQNARGRMQVTKPAWLDYGDGTPFESATDVQLHRAAIAKLNDDYRHYGGDVSKTAAAYIGGRGAVREDGSIRDDVSDQLGTTPLAYSQRVIGKLGVAPAAAPEAAPASEPDQFLQFMEGYMAPSQPQEAAKTASLTGDIGRLLKVGTNQAASDVRELVGRVPVIGKPIQRGLDAVDEFISGKSSEQLLKDDNRAMQEGLTPETRAAMEKKWWDEERGTFGDAWKDPRAYMTGVVQSLPETALMMFPAMRLAKGSFTAARAAGLSVELAAKKAATVATLTGSITEGLLGGAQAGAQVRDQILALPDEALQQSDAVKSLMAEGASFEDAKRAIAEDASTKAFLVAGVADGIFGGMGDRLLAGAITKGLKGGILTRIAKGIAAEGLLEEMPQSYLEKVAENLGMQTVDPTIPTTEGALNESLGGAVAGSIMGGGMAAPFSERAEAPAAPTDVLPEPTGGTSYTQLQQRQIEFLQGKMDLLRKEAGVANNNGDIYATPLGEQYQYYEDRLKKVMGAVPAQPAAPEQPSEEPIQEPDIAEPMRPFTERAMYGYQTQERAQKVAESMSKVQNGQYAVMPHPRLPGKFAVVPAEWVSGLPPITSSTEPTQEEISARLAQAAAQAPVPLSLQDQMLRVSADQAQKAIEARGGVASPVEAQILTDAGLGQPYDRIDPSLVPSEQQTTPREHETFPPAAEARAAEIDRLDQLARGTPAEPALDEQEVATDRLEEASRQAEIPRMDETERRLRDADEERRATAPAPTTLAGIILPEGVVRPEVKPIPFSQPPAPVVIAGKPVRDMSLGELNAYAQSKKPDVAAKAQAEIKFRDTPEGANEQAIRKQTKTPAFKQWFGDSKVVDETGTPLVVYHGTVADVEAFDTDLIGTRTVLPLGAPRGFYFAKDRDVASRYAKDDGANIVPAYVRITNPAPTAEAFNADPSYDGFINSKIVVARNPEQIKSAIGNRGTFNPKDTSISNARTPTVPVGSALPFGASYQTHRLAKVTEGNPARPDLVERSSLGPELSKFPSAFTKASSRMQVALNDAITDLVSMGMPESWLWGVRNIATHSSQFGATVRGRFSTHYNSNGRLILGLSLQRSLLERLGKDQSAPYQIRGVLAHEFGHVLNRNGIGQFTETSPLFDVSINEKGMLVPTGPIMQEVVDGYLLDEPTKGPLADLFRYPLRADGDLKFYKDETFAQLSSLFILNPALMQERLPTAYALFEEIKNATGNLRQDSAREAGSDQGGSGRERSLERAVQGAFRALSESAGGAVARGQRNGTPDARVAQDRQGRPGTRTDEDAVESGRHSGELLGSDFGSDIGHRREKKTGRYVGAPKTVTSPQTLAVMRKRIEQLATEGVEGRFWYEKSGKAILDLAEGNKDLAEKIVGLWAIYSPTSQVSSNTTMALKAYYEWADGKPITAISKLGHTVAEHAQRWMDGTASKDEVEGIKRSNFYKNLMREIDPERLGTDAQGVTVDMWIARAMGYLKTHVSSPGKNVKNGSGSEYGFAEREVKRIAQRLGWEPQQAQAAIWVAVKSRFDNIYNEVRTQAVENGWLKKKEKFDRYGKKAVEYHPANVAGEEAFEGELLRRAMSLPAQDVSEAAYDFADALKERTAQISWEAKPGETTGVLPGIFKAPLGQQAEYLDAVDRVLRDEAGQDEIAKMVGLAGSHTIFGPSAWKLDVGQGAQTESAVATDRPKQNTIAIHEPARDVFNLYSAIRGYILNQEAVAWHYPIFETSLKKANGIELRTERPLTHDEVKALYQAISERAGHSEFAPIYTPRGVRVLNFTDLANPKFHALVEEAYHSIEELPTTETGYFRSEGDLISNDWKENPYGQGYQERIAAAGRPDLQRRADDLKRRVDEINRDFSRRYGWGAATLEDRIGDVAGASEKTGVGQGVDGRNVPAVGTGTPRVSIRPQQADAQEVVGIHYSKAKGLSALDGARYGSGIKGAEARRLGYDPKIAPRVYFYLNQDADVLPTPEPGLGAEVHRAVLTNLYPFATDPAKIFPAIRNITDPDEKSNEMERRIIAAGYDGYANKNLGMAVVLNKGPVQVEHLGQYDYTTRGLRDIAGSSLAIPTDTDESTMTALLQRQIEAAGVEGNISLFDMGHARRVAMYATDLGRAAGLTPNELSILTSSAMLHDIGKVTLPEPVLNKHGKLTDEEHKVVEAHTRAAEALLVDHIQTIKSAAVQHHERWDGQGYPDGLAGEEISKYARIIAVADVFDALTATDRPYKKAWTAKEALKQLREWSGTHFEPGLIDKFEGLQDVAGSNEQAEPGPLWYSELSKTLEGIKQPTAPVGQWIAIIDNLTTKGIKKDEIEWSGVKDWLQMQQGKVTKDQIIQYLQQNGIKVEEVVKERNQKTLEETARRVEAAMITKRDAYKRLRSAFPRVPNIQVIVDAMDDAETDGQRNRTLAGFTPEQQSAALAHHQAIAELDQAVKDHDRAFHPTGFEKYTLPGGENYRELLLTLPEQRDFAVYGGHEGAQRLSPKFRTEKEAEAWLLENPNEDAQVLASTASDREFKSNHFAERNILAHVRFNERTDADGKRVLFIEEIQSDWGQKGKREGFVTKQGTLPTGWTVEQIKVSPYSDRTDWIVFDNTNAQVGFGAPTREGAIANATGGRETLGGIPSAPFVGKTGQWVSLAMKRMIRWAAEEGFDRIAWTTGEQQVARYDLSKQLNRIEVDRGHNDYFKIDAYDRNGDQVVFGKTAHSGNLAGFVGKELAEKMIAAEPGKHTYSGLDLKVGGEGMKDFYDKIVPNAANVLLKKLGGGRVGSTTLVLNDNMRTRVAPADVGTTEDDGRGFWLGSKGQAWENQPSLDITDAMRDTALQGMPLFAGSNEKVMPEWLAAMPQADQDAAKKAGIYVPSQTWQQRLQGLRNGWKERVTQGMFDQFAPIRQLDEHAYVLDRMTKGADAGLEALLMYGKPILNSAGALDAVDLDKGGVIQLFSELSGEHDRFLGWIAGQRAHLLKQQGRENLFTDTDISALRNWNQGQMKDGRDRAKLYADVHRRFNIFNRAVLDVAEQADLIDGAERAKWEADFYVPFYRVLESEGYEGPTDIGGLVNQYAFKRLRGGKEQLNDLFENTLRNWGHLIGASLKNQAAKASLEAAERAGVAVELAGREKGAVSFKDAGKTRWFAVEDPLILDAITSLEHAGISGGVVMKAFAKAKHYLTFGVTMAPAFKIRNLIRDQISAVALNPISGNLAGNLAQGWKLTHKDSDQYAHMLAGGGLMRFGTSLEGNRSEHVDRLVKMAVDDQSTVSTLEKGKDLVEKLWNAWQELGDRSENVTRAAVYRQAYDKAIKAGKGADEAHLIASFSARDSMDFALQGSYTAVRLLSQLVPFFNARLQGLYKIGREGVAPTMRLLSGNGKPGDAAKAIRFNSMAMAVSMASVLLMLSQADDEDWKAREDWDRDTYWWVKVGGQAFRIPKPFELGAIGSLAERGVEAIMNGLGPEDRKLFVQRLGWMLANTFSFNPTPQLVKPLIDLYANTDSFTGRPIESAGMERLSPAERIGPHTSTLARLLGKATGKLGLSPVEIDSLIDGYFSWVGSNILWVSDFVMRPATGAPEKATWRMEDYPVFGSFVRELPAPQAKYVTAFYENAERFGQLAADIQYYQKLGMTEEAMELATERKDEIGLAKTYERVKRQMGEINQAIRRVQVSDLSGDEKRARLDALNARKVELAKLVEAHRKAKQSQWKTSMTMGSVSEKPSEKIRQLDMNATKSSHPRLIATL